MIKEHSDITLKLHRAYLKRVYILRSTNVYKNNGILNTVIVFMDFIININRMMDNVQKHNNCTLHKSQIPFDQ
jgi:hypothetical protein